MQDGQFAVGKAQLATGIVLNNKGAFYISGNDLNTMYEIFDNYANAEKFALDKIISNPDNECWIVNSKGTHIITYDKYGERKNSL